MDDPRSIHINLSDHVESRPVLADDIDHRNNQPDQGHPAHADLEQEYERVDENYAGCTGILVGLFLTALVCLGIAGYIYLHHFLHPTTPVVPPAVQQTTTTGHRIEPTPVSVPTP